MKKQEKRKNVIYLRVAEKNDEELKRQETNLKNYTSLLGVEIDYIYKDNGYSGIDFDRPGFKQLIEDVKSNKINAVYIIDLAKLGREHFKTIEYIEKVFSPHGTTLISVKDNYNNIHLTMISKAIKDSIQDMYKKDIQERRKRSREYRQRVKESEK